MDGGVIVQVGEVEHLDKALRRFKKVCDRSRIMADFHRTRWYLKPSDRRKQKHRQALLNHRRHSKRGQA